MPLPKWNSSALSRGPSAVERIARSGLYVAGSARDSTRSRRDIKEKERNESTRERKKERKEIKQKKKVSSLSLHAWRYHSRRLSRPAALYELSIALINTF